MTLPKQTNLFLFFLSQDNSIWAFEGSRQSKEMEVEMFHLINAANRELPLVDN